MSYTLRYYSDPTAKTRHQILLLLEQIKQRHGVESEVYVFTPGKNGYPEETELKKIYDRDFRPRAKILAQRVGQPVRRALRSRQGRGGYFTSEVVAITQNGAVEWFAQFEEKIMVFLKDVLELGPYALDERCPPVKTRDVEDEIITQFIASGTLEGRFLREVSIKSAVKFDEGKVQRYAQDLRHEVGEVKATLEELFSKKVDLVCRQDSAMWILEAKEKLNYEALGQVLVYGDLFAEAQPQTAVKLGIVCRFADISVERACQKRGITIFVVPNSWEGEPNKEG